MIMKLWWSNWVFFLLRDRSNFLGGNMYCESVCKLLVLCMRRIMGNNVVCVASLVSFMLYMISFLSFSRWFDNRWISFFPQYAHRKCVQHWCNEKGDIICEICHKVCFFHMWFSHLGEFCVVFFIYYGCYIMVMVMRYFNLQSLMKNSFVLCSLWI